MSAPKTTIPAFDWDMIHRRMRATFNPKRLDDLRPELIPLIGETVEWRCDDYGREDDPYPGQYRWTTDDARWRGRWAPDEDLEPANVG